jgi:hypothetical protein
MPQSDNTSGLPPLNSVSEVIKTVPAKHVVVDEKKLKEEAEKKKEAELNTNLIAINRFLFLTTLLLMFISNLAIWIYLAH